MTYNFIKPSIKPIFNKFAKIWIAFFIFALAFIVCVYFFVVGRFLFINSQLEKRKEESVVMQEQITKNEALFDILTRQNTLALNISGKEGINEKSKKIIDNLFDLVIKSGSIKLDNVRMDKNSLELRGSTPTKEMFVLLIETPLKSIFDESKTSFYLLENGWFKFVSVNRSFGETDDER